MEKNWTVTDTCNNGCFTVLRRGPNSELPDIDMGNKEDAYLVAAAPLMFEALQDLIEIAKMEDWQYATTGRQILLKNAQAALNAAGGE